MPIAVEHPVTGTIVKFMLNVTVVGEPHSRHRGQRDELLWPVLRLGTHTYGLGVLARQAAAPSTVGDVNEYAPVLKQLPGTLIGSR